MSALASGGQILLLDEIYVPLGLVKRKQQSRIVGDVSPEQGSQLYEPEATEEITQRLEIDEFMVFSQSAETN